MFFRNIYNWMLTPVVSVRKKSYIKRLRFAYEQLEEFPTEGPQGDDRAITREMIGWLIRFYRGDPDALAEGTPEIKLAKTLRKSKFDFGDDDLLRSKILSHWIQYKHIEGF